MHIYHLILVTQLKQSVEMLFPGKNKDEWTFQEDNDPKHTSKMCKDYLKRQRINRMWRPVGYPEQRSGG